MKDIFLSELLNATEQVFDFKKIDDFQVKHLVNLANYFEYITTSEDSTSFAVLKDFPKVYSLVEIDKNTPHNGDFWESANVGDIVVKDGNHYVSSIANGSHFLVKESHGGDITFFSNTHEIGHLCFPEEFRVVDNIEDKIYTYLYMRGDKF